MGRFARALMLVAAVLALAACRVEGRVDVDVAANGSGTVRIGVGLDAEALAKLGDPTTALKASDLTDAGWTVAPPTKVGDTTWIRATKPFRSPADLSRVMGEVGLFRDWRLSVTDGFGSTTWKVNGQVVSTGSLDQFGDSALTTALDGLPVGLTPEDEAAQLKASGPIGLKVHLQLPGGDVTGSTSYSLDVAGAPAVTRTVSVSSTRTDGASTRWFLLAGLLVALGFVALVLGRLRATRRGRGRHARPVAPSR